MNQQDEEFKGRLTDSLLGINTDENEGIIKSPYTAFVRLLDLKDLGEVIDPLVISRVKVAFRVRQWSEEAVDAIFLNFGLTEQSEMTRNDTLGVTGLLSQPETPKDTSADQEPTRRKRGAYAEGIDRLAGAVRRILTVHPDITLNQLAQHFAVTASTVANYRDRQTAIDVNGKEAARLLYTILSRKHNKAEAISIISQLLNIKENTVNVYLIGIAYVSKSSSVPVVAAEPATESLVPPATSNSEFTPSVKLNADDIVSARELDQPSLGQDLTDSQILILQKLVNGVMNKLNGGIRLKLGQALTSDQLKKLSLAFANFNPGKAIRKPEDVILEMLLKSNEFSGIPEVTLLQIIKEDLISRGFIDVSLEESQPEATLKRENRREPRTDKSDKEGEQPLDLNQIIKVFFYGTEQRQTILKNWVGSPVELTEREFSSRGINAYLTGLGFREHDKEQFMETLRLSYEFTQAGHKYASIPLVDLITMIYIKKNKRGENLSEDDIRRVRAQVKQAIISEIIEYRKNNR